MDLTNSMNSFKSIKKAVLICTLTGVVLAVWTLSGVHDGQHERTKYEVNAGVSPATSVNLLHETGATIHDQFIADYSNILVVAYKRTGSTFLSQMLGARDDTFYWHEPLRFLQRNFYYRGDDLRCSYNKPTCEIISPGSASLTRKDYLRILVEMFNCNFTSVATQRHIALNSYINAKSITWDTLRWCETRRDTAKCMILLENACKAAKHRVIKVVHTDISGLAPLFTAVPILKVVQLFRDPRGTMNSRLRTSWYKSEYLKSAQDLEDDTKVLCSRMQNNIVTAERFLSEYHGRFKVVQYEDFVSFDAKICNLFTWLRMDCTSEHMRQSLSLFETVENAVTIDKQTNTPGNHPYLYRTQMGWETVKMIDANCRHFYDKLGYTEYETKEELRNLTLDLTRRLPYAM